MWIVPLKSVGILKCSHFGMFFKYLAEAEPLRSDNGGNQGEAQLCELGSHLQYILGMRNHVIV